MGQNKRRLGQLGLFVTTGKQRVYIRLSNPGRSRTYKLAQAPIKAPNLPWGGGGEVKRPWSEVGHSSPYSVDVKNEWSYTSNTSVSLHGVL
jgi:hypothetical protein